MPYIPTETVKEKRQELRKMFPDYKLSVVCDNYSSIDVSIMSGPIDIQFRESDCMDRYEQVNHFHIERSKPINTEWIGERKKVPSTLVHKTSWLIKIREKS